MSKKILYGLVALGLLATGVTASAVYRGTTTDCTLSANWSLTICARYNPTPG